jgi:hypothetical protein
MARTDPTATETHNAHTSTSKKHSVEAVTDPCSTSYLVLQILRDNPHPVAYVMAVSGATAGLISALTKRHLIIRWRDGAKEMLRLSVAGIAVVSAVAEAYAVKK